jgi:hypothetical protein
MTRSQPESEHTPTPVAWRWRQKGRSSWQYTEDKPDGPSVHLFELEPLYDASLKVRIEELEAALENCQSPFCGYFITNAKQYPKVLENFWKEIQRIDRTARAALQSKGAA